MNTEKQNLSTALKELEKVVDFLGQSDLDIEEGLKEFKKGVELVEFCRKELRQAENEFITLKTRLDKTAEEESQDEENFEQAV